MTRIKIETYPKLVFLLVFVGAMLLFPPRLFAQESLQSTSPESTYFQGKALMENKNLASARNLFEDYISNNPTGAYLPEANYYAAFCALILYHRDGEKLITNFIEEYPGHPKAMMAYFDLGSHYYRSRNYPKTIEFLSQSDLGKLNEKNRSDANFMLGYSYFSLRKFKQALPYFNRLKKGVNEYSYAAAYYAGYVEFESQMYKEAVADFTKAEQNEAYTTEIPYMKASAIYKSGDNDGLLEYASAKIASGDRYTNAHTMYLLSGEALFNKKEYEKAAEFYNSYQGMIKGRVEADVQYRIAYCQFRTEQNDAAIENFKSLASVKGEIGLYANYYLGVLYQGQGNSRYALTAFDKLRLSNVNSQLKEDASYHFAKLSYDVGNSMPAIFAMEEYLKTYPDGNYNQEIVELLSDAYLSSSDYPKAISYIEGLSRRTENINRAYQKATFLQGTVDFNKGEYRQSVTSFDKSLEYPLDRETTIKALYWKGEAYSVGRRFEEALGSYKAIVDDSRNKGDIHYVKAKYGLGYSYYNTNEYEKALAEFTGFVNQAESIVAEKFIADAKIRMGDCHYVAKRYEQAIASYGAALSMNYSDRDYANLQIGVVSMLLDKNTDARGRFDRVISSGQRSRYYDDGLFQKAQLMFNMSQYEQCINLYTKLISEKPSSVFIPYALMRRASAYFNIQKFDESVNDYQKLLKDHITHEMAKNALLPLQEVLASLSRGNEYDAYFAAYKKANPDEKGLETVEFESSKNFYFNQEYRKAIAGLKSFIRSYPDDARIPESKFYIGDAYFRLQALDSARIWLTPLSSNKSLWQYPRVIERMAELELKDNNYQKAADYYGISEALANNNRIQNQARSGRMISFYKLTKYDSAIAYAEKILASGGTDVIVENQASLYLGKSYFALGRYEQAKDEFLNTTNLSKDAFGAEAQYLLGVVFNNTKEYRQSIEVLIDLNDKYQTYQEWVGKGFLLIADNYVMLDDFFQARGTLNSLLEYFPGEQIKREARAKMKLIDEMEQRKILELERMSTDSIVVDTLRSNAADSLKNEDN